MIKSKKILAATVMASLLGGVSASYATTVNGAQTITVEAEVGAKTLKDVLKLSANQTTKAPKRAPASTDKAESVIADFLVWDDINSGNVKISISSGPTDANGEYVIENGHSDKMPVAFEIDGNKLENTSSPSVDFSSLTQGTKKDLKVVYGDGSSSYSPGTYKGDFTFSIEATF